MGNINDGYAYGKSDSDKFKTNEDQIKKRNSFLYSMLIVAGVIVIILIIALSISSGKTSDSNPKGGSIEIKLKEPLTRRLLVSSISEGDSRTPYTGNSFQVFNPRFKGKKPRVKDQNGKELTLSNEGVISDPSTTKITLEFDEIITDCSYMFSETKGIVSIDLTKFKTQEVKDFSDMFRGSDVEEVDLGEDFQTENVETSEGMFSGCENVEEIKMPNEFQVGESAKSMFEGTKNLKSLNTLALSSKTLKSLDSMFMDSGVEVIEFNSDFSVENVVSAKRMFSGSKVKSLDMSEFYFQNLVSYEEMFMNCQIEEFYIEILLKNKENEFLEIIIDGFATNVEFYTRNEYHTIYNEIAKKKGKKKEAKDIDKAHCRITSCFNCTAKIEQKPSRSSDPYVIRYSCVHNATHNTEVEWISIKFNKNVTDVPESEFPVVSHKKNTDTIVIKRKNHCNGNYDKFSPMVKVKAERGLEILNVYAGDMEGANNSTCDIPY